MSAYNFYDKLEKQDAGYGYKFRTYLHPLFDDIENSKCSEEESQQWKYIKFNSDIDQE